MPAHVEYAFEEKPFLLNEESLRKLYDVVSDSLQKHASPPKICFKVYRGDAYSYETEDLELVCKEDNDDWRSLTRLDIKAAQDKFQFELVFRRSSGASIEIAGDSRNDVLVLFTDLKSVMNEHILRKRPPSSGVLFQIVLLLTFGVMIGMMVSISGLLQENISTTLPNDASVEDKIDRVLRLVSSRHTRERNAFMWLLPSLAIMALVIPIKTYDRKIMQWIFPSNSFLFGEQRRRFEKREQRKAQLVWGVLVAFLVSLAAGLVLLLVPTQS